MLDGFEHKSFPSLAAQRKAQREQRARRAGHGVPPPSVGSRQPALCSAPLPAPAAQPQTPEHRAELLPGFLPEFLQTANVSYLFIGSFQQK